MFMYSHCPTWKKNIAMAKPLIISYSTGLLVNQKRMALQALMAGCIALLLSSCETNQLVPFEQPASVYFGSPTVFGTAVMSKDYSFAKYPNRTTDTIRIPVSLLGEASAKDREITVVPADSSIVNARPGIEYKLLTPYKLPANAYSTTIPVVVYRTGNMDSLTYTLILKIVANEDLQPGVNAQTQYRINIAYLQKPADWDRYANAEGWAKYSANFGTWTRTKYKVVLEALYSPSGDTSITNFPGQRFSPPPIFAQYLQIVKNYIKTKYPGNYSTPLGIGPTLRDPDAGNEVIQVGPANY
jgi:hypothetical protein